MTSSVISKEDFAYMRMLHNNIKWMKELPNAEDYLICTKKENKLLQDYITKL